MEQKKILWIIFSVMLLAVVVVGAGLIWFFPNNTRASAKNLVLKSGNQGKEVLDPVEWVRKNQEYPGLTVPETEDTTPGEDFIIVFGESEDGKQTTPSTPGPLAAPIPDARPVKPAAEKPAVTTQPPASTKPPAAAVKPAETKPKTVRVEEYWIQTGSYAGKTRAEEVKDVLAEKGVASKITSRLVDGNNYFRVRIGPYPNKPEAEKFLAWIKAIQGFDGSYISLVYTTKEVR